MVEKTAPQASASATTPEKVAASAAQAEAAEQLTAPLTRDGAILMALAHNRGLVVERYGVDIDKTGVAEARASFDPSIEVSTSYSESERAVDTGGSSAYTGVDPIDTTSLGTVLQGVESYLSAIQSAADAIQNQGNDIGTSRQSSTTATLSEYLPTGTELFLSGGLVRNGSSLDDDHDYSGTWSIGVTQPLLRGFGPAVNLASLRQSKNSAEASRYALADFAMGLIRDVETAYWRLALARETLATREFAVKLAKEQLDVNVALIEVGKLAESARVSAEAGLASAKANLVDARAAVQERAIELWRLLGGQGSARDAASQNLADAAHVEEIPLDTETSVALARLYRPDLMQARLNLENRELEVVTTKNGLLPKLDLSASYGRNSSGTSSRDATRYLDTNDYTDFQVGVSFGMSLTNRAERARHLRARLSEKQAKASIANLEQVIETEVTQAVVEVERQWEQINATQEEVRNREEELQIEQDKFRLGQSTNLDVLQVQQSLIEAKVSESTARSSYIQALTALYYAEGSLLERRGVTLTKVLENES